MARGVNKIILLGNLGSDPEVRSTHSGSCVTTLSVATTEQYKDAQGQQQEITEWHRVVLWNRLAEVARDYLKKGRQVYIEGSIKTRKWQDKEGKDRYTTEIVANNMQMIGSAQSDQNYPPPASFDDYPEMTARSQPALSTTTAQTPGQRARSQQQGSLNNFDDDEVPF